MHIMFLTLEPALRLSISLSNPHKRVVFHSELVKNTLLTELPMAYLEPPQEDFLEQKKNPIKVVFAQPNTIFRVSDDTTI